MAAVRETDRTAWELHWVDTLSASASGNQVPLQTPSASSGFKSGWRSLNPGWESEPGSGRDTAPSGRRS